MSNRPPNSPPRTTDPSTNQQRMTEVQPPLPLPTFSGRPEYAYSSYPDASSSYSNRDMTSPYSMQDPRAMAPPRESGYDRAAATRLSAVPIAALLSDDPPVRDDRGYGIDSFSHPAPMRGFNTLSSPDRPSGPSTSQYASYSAESLPVSPYGPAYTTSARYGPPPPDPYQPPTRTVRPIFTSSSASTQYHPMYHPRQPASLHSPVSGSSGSQRAYSIEPQSALSEQSMAMHAFQAMQTHDTPEYKYSLVMRQQPKAARACGFGERDRRVIDPPPIIEVRATDAATGESHVEGDSYCTLHCILVNAATGRDESTIAAPRPDLPAAQRLMGAAVASPWVGDDEHGVRGSFFVFSDLSVRSPGKYKLLFRLLKVNPLAMSKKYPNFIRANIESDPFEVFPAKEFPGMKASSALLRALRAQGLNVGVKKGSEAKGKGKADGAGAGAGGAKAGESDEGSDEGEERDDSDGEGDDESSRSTAKAKAEDEEPGTASATATAAAGAAKGKRVVKRPKV